MEAWNGDQLLISYIPYSHLPIFKEATTTTKMPQEGIFDMLWGRARLTVASNGAGWGGVENGVALIEIKNLSLFEVVPAPLLPPIIFPLEQLLFYTCCSKSPS